MVGWHHWPNGHEFEQAPGDDEGQGSLACCSPRGHRVGYYLVTEKQQFIYMLELMVASIIYIMASLISGDGILLIKKFHNNTFCMA